MRFIDKISKRILKCLTDTLAPPPRISAAAAISSPVIYSNGAGGYDGTYQLRHAINAQQRTAPPSQQERVIKAAISALEDHHLWHQKIGVVGFPYYNDPNKYTDVDLSDGYADSKLCDETCAAIKALRDLSSGGES